MKSNLWPAIVATLLLVLLTGCARYKVTFANQSVTTARGKPKHNKADGTYVFTDAKGEKRIVPAFTVQSIEPH